MYCHILRVRAIPTLESTDSMIIITADCSDQGWDSTIDQNNMNTFYFLVGTSNSTASTGELIDVACYFL